jgi:hypothetical protein
MFVLSDSPASELSLSVFRKTLFHLRLNKKRPMKMEDTECSETSAQKILTPRNRPKERTLQSQYGANLKSRMSSLVVMSTLVFTLLNTEQYHALFIVAVQNDIIVCNSGVNKPELQVTVGSIFVLWCPISNFLRVTLLMS